MATRTAKNLSIGQLASTTLTTIYTAPSNTNTTMSVLGFTNTSTSVTLVLDIYRNDGSTDYLVRTITIPPGSGREVLYYGLQKRVFNAGHSVKIQADSATAFNYDLNGSELAL